MRKATDQEEQLALSVENAKKLQDIAKMEGWKLLFSVVRSEIDWRRERLCQDACDRDETIKLRGQVEVLRFLSALSDPSDAHVKQLEQQLAALRKAYDARHDLQSLQRGNQP